MALARSKVTAQGQISVPAEVRRRLGVGPGSVLEWDEEGETIVVRRAARYTSNEIHRALFLKQAPKPRMDETRQRIRRRLRTKIRSRRGNLRMSKCHAFTLPG